MASEGSPGHDGIDAGTAAATKDEWRAKCQVNVKPDIFIYRLVFGKNSLYAKSLRTRNIR